MPDKKQIIMYNNELLCTLIDGACSAERYISEDLEAICDDTMREYAKGTLENLQKGIEAGKELAAIMKNNGLLLDVLTDITMHVAYQQIQFEDSNTRNDTLRIWAQEFVQKYAGTDWQKMDYTILVGEYAVEMVNQYRQLHPQQEKPFKASFVFGTEAVRKYEDAYECGGEWDEEELSDLGAVGHYSFETQRELEAFKQGIESATGYLESSYLLNEEEWTEHVREIERYRLEDEEDE